jgi:FlaA1/EpsC-like NDP-sugar epimerase
VDNKLKKFFHGKVVLVTGGTGSIGSELVKKLVAFPTRQVRIFSRGEYKQYSLEKELSPIAKGKARFLIGDIRDRERVFLAMEGVDIIINTAAMKHVPLCEYNPFEAIKTNVLGTQNLVDASRANNIEKFVHVSTDKAALPGNVMGATKLLAEKIVLSAEHYKGPHKTIFSAVRFGNVFGSRGSVVPLFCKQIRNGESVTITDKHMTRFIMRIPQAAELVLQAALLSRGEELFILKMPVMKIYDLAKAMIAVLAPQYGHKAAKIEIDVIGKRDGEKIFEALLTEEEAEHLLENKEMFCITKKTLPGFTPSKMKQYRSDLGTAMNYDEVLEFCRRSFII